ncbi:MAG: SDR family NAD(P)-dependent oxidoreductase, partial [Roseomonas sp.]|nr:SDR family NAD(P)-dependent oxidoreductase [Roseomonas sp.]
MAGTTSRIVLITGAAGGIGHAMVASLLAAGHRIAALDYDAKGLDALLTAYGSHPD